MRVTILVQNTSILSEYPPTKHFARPRLKRCEREKDED